MGQVAPPWAPGGAAVGRGGSALPKILGGIAVLIVGVIVIGLLATAGPADAVTAHLAALARGDDAAAYAMTSSSFRSGYSAAEFTAVVNANPILRNGKVSIGERQVVGDGAVITVELTAPDGTKQSFDFQLGKEGSSWKIEQYGFRAPTSQTTPAVASAARATGAPAAAAPAPVAGRSACTSTATQAFDPAPIAAAAPKLRGRMQAGAFGVPAATFGGAPPSSLADTGTRTFSIAALKALSGETLYFMADAPSPADFPRSNYALEICDANNMTNRPEGPVRSLKGFPLQMMMGPTLSGVVTDISAWTPPDAPGAYRVDAYVWLEKDNAWHLVGRLPLTLTP